ncbi:MAG TPA: LysR substrate-binding domain-containing protein [Burkholderiaceae bacterium]|nr:LysR substrate-binding domain-containing protein [Burkholderiaceae bacterium]
MSELTLEALKLVDAIARRGSFAQAAEELGRVPSAVTYAVRRLEQDLDVLLFDRRGYRAQLTPAGEELLREGRHLLAAADELAQRVRRVASGWEQELTLALDNVIAFSRLLPLIEEFTRVAPTQLRITDEVLGGTWDALLSGRADLAIGAMQEGPEPSRLGAGYRAEKLGSVSFVFVVAPSHPLAAFPSPLPAGELRRHRQVVVADTSQRLAPRAAGLLGLADVLTVPTLAAKIEAQKAGLGCGFIPSHLVRDDIARGALVVRTTDQERGDGTMHFAWRNDARGRAVAWWLAKLRMSATRAALAA